jgi:hypothetical protein
MYRFTAMPYINPRSLQIFKLDQIPACVIYSRKVIFDLQVTS